jgi:pilus assembly protein CpaB
MKNRTIIGIVCMVLAVAVMFGIAPLVNKVSSGTIKVVQVVKRIEQGGIITAESVKTTEVGKLGTRENVIKDQKQVIGKYATATLMPNNNIYPEMVSDKADSAEDVFRQLNGTKQAISITIPSFANGLSGKLKNDDIVSVLVVNDNQSIIPAELTYVKVITTTTSKGTDSDKLTTNEDGTTELPATATLLVSPEQAKLLALYDQKAKVYLTLVYRGDTATAEKFLKAQSEVLKDE